MMGYLYIFLSKWIYKFILDINYNYLVICNLIYLGTLIWYYSTRRKAWDTPLPRERPPFEIISFSTVLYSTHDIGT